MPSKNSKKKTNSKRKINSRYQKTKTKKVATQKGGDGTFSGLMFDVGDMNAVEPAPTMPDCCIM